MILPCFLAVYYMYGIWLMWCGYTLTPEDNRQQTLIQWWSTFLIIPWLWPLPTILRFFNPKRDNQ